MIGPRNPPIPTKVCFKCGVPTDETQSVHGVGHYRCYKDRVNKTINPQPART